MFKLERPLTGSLVHFVYYFMSGANNSGVDICCFLFVKEHACECLYVFTSQREHEDE